MTQSYDFNALMQQAQAEGLGPSATLENGRYLLQAQTAKVSNTQGGKDQIGVRWVVLESHGGASVPGTATWENQTISPENSRAMGAFFGFAARFGMDATFWARQPQPSLAEVAHNIQDVVILADVGQRIWGTNKDKVDNTFKIIENRGKGGAVPAAPLAAPTPVAVAPAPAPAAPVPAPAPVAPVVAMVAAPVPVAATMAPAPVAPVQEYVAPAPVPQPAPIPQPAPLPVTPPVPEVPAPVAAIDPATGLPAMPAARTF